MKNKYAAGFFMGLKEEIQYRADYLTNLISVVFPLMIQLSLWTILFSGKPEETVIMGYTFPQMMLYSVTATMSARFLATEVHSSVAQDIRDGALEPEPDPADPVSAAEVLHLFRKKGVSFPGEHGNSLGAAGGAVGPGPGQPQA